jgi:hypothetical protein
MENSYKYLGRLENIQYSMLGAQYSRQRTENLRSQADMLQQTCAVISAPTAQKLVSPGQRPGNLYKTIVSPEGASLKLTYGFLSPAPSGLELYIWASSQGVALG